MDDLLAAFLTETSGSLAALDLALARLQRAPGDAAALSLAFRRIHTLKGSCGFLGFARLGRLAGAAEALLDGLDSAGVATPEAVAALAAGIERIRRIVAGIDARGQEPRGRDVAVLESLAAASGRQSGGFADRAAAA